MTAQLEPPVDRLQSELSPWIAKADALVRGKMADAAAHAAKVITAKLKRTADGRPTARVAARSPSYQAAASRLDELLEALAGPSTASLSGLLRDARAHFFTHAVEWWRSRVDPRFYRAEAEVTQAGLNTVRGAIFHGYDLRRELADDFATAKRTLHAACNMAGHSTTAASTADVLIKTWHKKTADRLAAACAANLADAQWALFWAAETVLQTP